MNMDYNGSHSEIDEEFYFNPNDKNKEFPYSTKPANSCQDFSIKILNPT